MKINTEPIGEENDANPTSASKMDRMKTKVEVKEANASKKERSEQLRQEAMWRRSEEAKKRKEAIAFGIGQVDAAQNAQGKRTVFEDDTDEEAGKTNGKQKNGSQKPSSSKVKLFDDDDSDEEPVSLNIENRHKGDKGVKLMKLEAAFGNDPRFKFDDKFASSSDSEEEGGDQELDDEKKKQKEMLAKILGRSVKEFDGSMRPPFPRFDPTNEEHVQWVETHKKKKEEKTLKKKKKDESSSSSDDEENEKEEGTAEGQGLHRIEVEMDNSFADELRKKMRGETTEEDKGFSFLSMIKDQRQNFNFEQETDSESEQSSEEIEEEEAPKESKQAKLMKKILNQEEGESNIEKLKDLDMQNEPSVAASTQKTQNRQIFFVDGIDPHIKSVVSNFRRTQSMEKVASKWASYRDSIMKIYKSKKKDAARKKRQDWGELTRGRGKQGNKRRNFENSGGPPKRSREETLKIMADAIDSILSSSKKEPRFYQLLNCDKSSSTEQIQAEYRQLARKLHPDKQTEEDRPEASKKFSEIQNAYELLTNENRRKLYDQWLSYPLPMDFEEFERNSDAIRMSMHWASPRQTPMIASEEKEKKKPEEKIKQGNRWSDEQRHHSAVIDKFRNYAI
ncbi:hypothetical protein WR25_00035 [Diploscapter pachys]|uniref:J domain-containing protein n=1 Tax=Diploscapter pachys TaxID=2018661 RepID=A0A2A2KE35_9BILA|nr:hypothetical protein WR25_00035 [Diploscapter pachys]